MEAAKSYTDIYLELPIEEYLVVPFGIFAQFAYIFVVLTRASFLEMDGWDVKALRKFIDFSTLMEEASKRYDAVSQTRPDGLVLKNDAFAKWSAKTKWAKAFYDTKFLSTTSHTGSTSQSGPENRSVNNTVANQDTCPAQPTLDLGSPVYIPTPLEDPTNPSLNPSTGFDYNFWADFDDPMLFTGDLDLGFKDL
jgi:hypothetical protein